MFKKILITILIIIGIGFILIIYNPLKPNNLCSNLDEEACFNNEQCRGVYGPSSCNWIGHCTTDEAYKGCELLSIKNQEKVKQDKILCQNTGGKWKNTKLSQSDECDCQQYYFKENEGCVSNQK